MMYTDNDWLGCFSVVHMIDRDKLESVRLYLRHDGFDDLRRFRAVTMSVVQDDDRT